MNSRGIHRCLLALIVVVWLVFLIGILAAVIGKPLAFVEVARGDYLNVWVLAHLAGVLLLPILVALRCLILRRLIWSLIVPLGAYLLTTLLAYPAAVHWIVSHHPSPKSSNWDWVESKGGDGDYLYVDTTRELGDAQYAGRITLFPPNFELPEPARVRQ